MRLALEVSFEVIDRTGGLGLERAFIKICFEVAHLQSAWWLAVYRRTRTDRVVRWRGERSISPLKCLLNSLRQ